VELFSAQSASPPSRSYTTNSPPSSPLRFPSRRPYSSEVIFPAAVLPPCSVLNVTPVPAIGSFPKAHREVQPYSATLLPPPLPLRPKKKNKGASSPHAGRLQCSELQYCSPTIAFSGRTGNFAALKCRSIKMASGDFFASRAGVRALACCPAIRTAKLASNPNLSLAFDAVPWAPAVRGSCICYLSLCPLNLY